MQSAVFKQCDRLLTLFHIHGLHAAVLAGLVMTPVVVAAGFVTDRPGPPTAFLLAGPTLRGSLDPPTREPATAVH